MLRTLVLLTILICSVGSNAQPLRLALNWKPEPQFGGFYAAQKEGFFKNSKLEVQILEGGSGTPTIQMLAAGKTEYAIVSADEVVIAHDRGAKDLVAIFASYQTNPQAIMTHAERDYKTLDDLLGDSKATLLWQSGLPYALFLKKKKSKFSVQTAPYLGGITNFQKDAMIAQQCFATSEPLTAKKAKIETKVFLVADSGYNPYTTVLVTKASRLKEKPEEVKQMVEAVRLGWMKYLENPKATNDLMFSMNKAMDRTTFDESAKLQMDLIQTDETKVSGVGSMTEARWKALADQLKELKLIKATPKATELFQNL